MGAPPGWVKRWLKDGGAAAIKRNTGLAIPDGLNSCLGCGFYGCAFDLDDPAWVVKLSIDRNEGPLVHRVTAIRAELEGREWRGGPSEHLDGVVWFRDLFRSETRWRGSNRTVWVIVRERIMPLITTSFDLVDNRDAIRALLQAKEAAANYNHPPSRRSPRWRPRQEYLDRFYLCIPTIALAWPAVALAMEDLAERGILLQDVHLDNLGYGMGERRVQWEEVVIFDLGVTATPQDEGAIRRLNPGGAGVYRG